MTAELSEESLPPEAIDAVALLVSELVGNAVGHARPRADGTIGVSWRLDGQWLRLEVTDGGGVTDDGGRRESPRLVHSAPSDVHGRGLSIVNALSARWGVRRAAGRSTVWAAVPARATPPAAHGRSRLRLVADG